MNYDTEEMKRAATIIADAFELNKIKYEEGILSLFHFSVICLMELKITKDQLMNLISGMADEIYESNQPKNK